jgi:hypothetical protein
MFRFCKGGGVFHRLEIRESFMIRDLYFKFVSLRDWIVIIMLLKISLNCFYQIIFLVYTLFCFSCMDVISLIYGFLRW